MVERSTKPSFRWAIPVCVGVIMFSNHFTRDSVGALEKELEGSSITPSQYATLNFFYFAPNMVIPLVAGMFVDKDDIYRPFFLSIFILSIGHAMFAQGVSISNVPLMNAGRFIAGSMYEIVDVIMPIAYLAKYFDAQDWGVVVGIMNLFLRAGSAANFLLTPIVYKEFGVAAAFWCATLVSFVSLIVLTVSAYVDQKWKDLDLQLKGAIYDNKNASSDDYISNDRIENEISKDERLNKLEQSNLSWSDYFYNKFPLHKISWSFYLYLFAGSFLYGSMVPFWFVGSKFLQDYYNISVVKGDSLLIIPEMMIVFISLPLGLYLKKANVDVSKKLRAFAASAVLMGMSYLSLVSFEPSSHSDAAHSIYIPFIIVFFLGLGYAFSNVLFWGAITEVVGPSELSFASGLVSSAVNILPAALPAMLTYALGPEDLEGVILMLAFLAILSAVCALLSAGLFKSIKTDNDKTLKRESGPNYELVPLEGDGI